MLRRSWILVGLVCVGATSARADANYSIHVLGTSQVTWTDNLFAVPDDAVDPLPPHDSDFQIQFRPGVLGAYETLNTIHNLEYALEANLYLEHDEARSLGHFGSWRGFFVMTPRTEVQTAVMFSSGALAALSTSRPPAEGQPVATTSGNGTYWGLDATEGLQFGVTPDLRVTQGVGVRRFSSSIDGGGDTGGYELGASVGADRGWKHTAVALSAQSRYVVLQQAMVEDARTINSALTLSYRRDVTPRWSVMADAGGAWVAALDGLDTIQPTAGVNVSYAPVWGAAGFQVRRTLAPNLYIAENTISDTAVINASLPTPWLTDDPLLPKLTVSGALGASRSQVIRNDEVTSTVNVVNADVALTYAPRGDVTLTARAQHLRQLPGEQSGMGSVSLEYDRTTFVVSVAWRFPERLAAEIPMRDSLRVDRSDNTPVGDEVAPSTAP